MNILVGKNGAEKAAKKVTEMLQHHQVGPQLGRAWYPSQRGIPSGTVPLTSRRRRGFFCYFPVSPRDAVCSVDRGGDSIPAAHHEH